MSGKGVDEITAQNAVCVGNQRTQSVGNP
jgi:hypothetical protein